VNPLSLARLLRLASPALPVGAFSYSQALEWAVESGAVRDEASTQTWLQSLVTTSVSSFEMPALLALIDAWLGADAVRAATLNSRYVAMRETMELRSETLAIGSALRAALAAGRDIDCTALNEIPAPAYPTSFAFAAFAWNIPATEAALSYGCAWLENQVTNAIKLVPLGQSCGQRLISGIAPEVVKAVQVATQLDDESWSNFAPLHAIASCKHETQYTRLFRS
jgi:urease accessory protein